MSAPTAITVCREGEPRTLSTIDELAVEVRAEHARALASASAVVVHAIRCGELLLKAKARIPHGHWRRWVAEKVLADGLRWSSVNAYMRFARHQAILRDGRPTTPEDATRLLHGHADARLDPGVRDQARELRDEGMTYDQIAEQLAISKGCAWRLTNPHSYAANRRKKRNESIAAKRALGIRERDAAVQRRGGSLAQGYALIRRAAQELDRALAAADSDERQHIVTAIGRLHRAEDSIGCAVRGVPADSLTPINAVRKGAA